MLDVLERMRAASLARDAAGLAALYREDAVHEFPFVTPGAPPAVHGRAAILELNELVFSAVPFVYDSYRTIAVHEVSPTVLVVEQEALGRNTATGQPFVLPNVWVVHVDDDGLVVRLRDYVNPAAIAAALGDVSVVPGGG